MNDIIVFFRNDDIRDKLDQSLIDLTDLFVKYKIPITHAVEPANITQEVVEWLLDKKKKYPNIIEIMQHGYDHKIKNKYKKGEFGGQRTYDEQYKDIKAGKELMNKYFGKLWFEAFNFPYAPYNPAAIKAVDDCGFKVFNSHFNHKWNRKVFYILGHLVRKGYWLGHHVSWNLRKYPGTNLFEIDMNFGFIKRYINEETNAEFMNLQELIEFTRRYRKFKTIGILLHHRYHDNQEKVELVNNYLQWCLKQDFIFFSMEKIYEKFNR